MYVILDGRDRREFVDIDAPEFYRALAAGARVGTSQPSPGAFLQAYERLSARGAKRIVSMHISSALSGTVNSARIAAGMSPVPVHVVDTGQASFIEGLCVWEGCEVLAGGGSFVSVATAVRLASEQAGNVFIVRGLSLLQKGGRMAEPERPGSVRVPVLALVDDAVRPVGSASTVEEAMGRW